MAMFGRSAHVRLTTGNAAAFPRISRRTAFGGRDWRTMSCGSADALSVIMAYNEIIGDNLPVDLVCRNRRSQLNRVSG